MQRVLITGAGPTGLVLALWLTKQGVDVRIIDESTGPGETSRALAVQARTLELYRQLDLAERIIEEGHKNPALNLWVGGRKRARLSFSDAGSRITPYPFVLVYPQDWHERVLSERLHELGVRVERQTQLLSFEERGDHVTARVRTPSGAEQTFDTPYLLACDGARSLVRHQLGVGFEGGTYKQLFYVADVQASGIAPADEVNLALDTADFVAVLSYGKAGQSRLIGTVRDARPERVQTLRFDDVSHAAIDRLGLRVDKVNWFSTYRVHHRVAEEFRRGRVFLLGDAAHVHSPAGGQGMNTGISDAINLAWKLAAVLHGQAPDSLLDSYPLERQAFARKLVATTDRVFSFVAAEGRLANLVRRRVAPSVASVAYRSKAVRELLFRLISQTRMAYSQSPLCAGRAGSVAGGSRLPWVPLPGADNYEPLRDTGWQVHVYGKAAPDVHAWCERHALPLHVFAYRPAHEAAGLLQDAAYVLRPDTYVGLAEPQPTAAALSRYFAARGYSANSPLK